MANLVPEQLTINKEVVIAPDQVLTTLEIREIVKQSLGDDKVSIETINGFSNLIVYKGKDTIKEILLIKNITYLGGNGQHPLYKKRIQLPKRYKEIYESVKDDSSYSVRFIGVYAYEDNRIFTDFVKDTYVKKKMNNSAAHVYVNDLFQAMENGVFEKIDQNGNKVVTVNSGCFKDYLDGKLEFSNDIIKIIDDFNKDFPFNNVITAMEAIPDMYESKWSQWKQTEWQGFYLEFIFNKYLKSHNLNDVICYTALSNKEVGKLDFDIYFVDDDFYGDLKASDIAKKVSPGNDKESLIKALEKNKKFWYLIYEHDTNKDKDYGFEATRFRNNYIKNHNELGRKEFSELSYSNKMKHSVSFRKMMIIELNKVNYRDILTDFYQGKQQSGKERKVKFNINKRNIDNVVIYNYVNNLVRA